MTINEKVAPAADEFTNVEIAWNIGSENINKIEEKYTSESSKIYTLELVRVELV